MGEKEDKAIAKASRPAVFLIMDFMALIFRMKNQVFGISRQIKKGCGRGKNDLDKRAGILDIRLERAPEEFS